MIKDFRKTIKFLKNKNGQFSFFDILQLPHTVISNSEKLTHPIRHITQEYAGEKAQRVPHCCRRAY